MPQRTVSVGIVADVNNYVANMHRAEIATRKTAAAAVGSEKQLRAQGEVYTKLGTAAMAGGALAAAGLALVISKTADYGAKMAQLQSLSHATNADMQRLSAAAMKQGQAFGQSATQVADAEIELTKAGRDASQILGGDLKGALALAAAGQMDVAQATAIGVTALTQFRSTGATIPQVADALAAGADKALGSVQDLGQALNQGGLVASQMGLNLNDTVGTLSAFAQAGLIGSDAGTSFKTMLLSLQSPSKQAQAYLEKYNITAYDSQGKFVGITNLAGQLQTAFKGVSQANRDAALSTIFGTDAIRAANVLYTEGAKGIGGWINAVDDTGFASAQAAGKMNSLSGDVQKLGASFDTNLIKAGTGANDSLRGLVQTANGLVSVVGEIPAPLLTTGLALMTAGAAVATFGGALVVGRVKLAQFRVEAAEAGVSVGGLGKSLAKGAGAAVGIAALTSALAGASRQGQATTEDLAKTGQSARNSFKGLDKLFTSTTFGGAQAGLKNALDYEGVGSWIQKAASLNGLIGGLSDTVLKNEGTFDALGQQLAGLAQQDLPAAQQAFAGIAQQAGLSREQQAKLLEQMGPYRDELAKQLGQTKVRVTAENEFDAALGRGAAGQALAAAATKAASAASKEQQDALSTLAGAANTGTVSVNALKTAIDGLDNGQVSASEAAIAMQQAIEAAGEAAKKGARGLDIHTQAGQENQHALNGIVTTAEASAKAYLDAGGGASGAAKIIRDGKKAWIDNAAAMLGSRSAAKKLADAFFNIPKVVKPKVSVPGVDGALSSAEALKAKLNSLTNGVWTVDVRYAQTGSPNDSGLAGTARARRAAGGAINGSGPKGKDSVPAVLAPGEHVLTAGDVDAMGGQGNVYAFRAALHMAAGGAVGDAQRSVNAAKKALSAAQRAYSRASKKGKSDAKAKVDDAKQRVADQQSRLTALRNDREDFVSTQRRATAANPIDPLSFVDQLRSMSRDSNISSARQAKYSKTANQYERSLVTLTTKSQAAAQKLSDLTDASKQLASSVTTSIAGRYTSSSAAATQTTSGWTVRDGIRFQSTTSGLSAASLDSYWKNANIDTATFASQLQQLAKRGLNPQLLAEIAQDANGPQLAAAFLAANGSQIASINSNYTATQSNAAAAGQTIGDYNYKALIEDAQKNADTITKQLASDGEKLRKLIADAFGLKGYATGTPSASRGFHLVGEQGPELMYMSGGERVWNASQTAYIRGGGAVAARSAVSKARSVVQIHVSGDDSVLARAMSVVAKQEIAADQHEDAVLMYGGPTL